MALKHWYELRVAGSAGTSAGTASRHTEGIALAENGRLCAVSSGSAKKFDSEQEAIEFLGKTTIPGVFQLEPVRCEARPRKP